MGNHQEMRKPTLLNDALRSNPSGSFRADRKRRKSNTILNICTYLVRTLRTDDDLNRLVESTSEFSWDIIGLCETKGKGGLWELKNGHWIFEAGKTEQDRNAKGLAALVNRRIRAFVKNFNRHSDSVVSMELNLTG